MPVARPHFAFPMVLDANGHPQVTEQDEIDHIRDQIDAALSTRIGQRLERPSWGTPDLTFRQQPLDAEALSRLLVELVPGAELVIDQLPDLVQESLVRLNVYVSTGG
jgi:hypothetical protein